MATLTQFCEQICQRQAEDAAQRERARVTPPIPAAPAAGPPPRTSAPYRFKHKAASHEQLVRLHALNGFPPPKEPSPSEVARQQAIHPGERRKLLREFEENEVYLAYGEHDDAQKEAAR